MKIILGSASPRRKYFFSLLFNDFKQVSPEVDETPLRNEGANLYVNRVSALKADFFSEASYAAENSVVLTGDTIVSLNDAIMGKPANRKHAEKMLSQLSGNTHKVITALSLVHWQKRNISIKTEDISTEVTFKELAMSDIHNYLDTIEWRDKAGAYAIQSHP
jgi:septum formation protein